MVSGDSWRYLLVEDPIPAGAEQIERSDLYELVNPPPWWSYWGRRELRDDRAAFFDYWFQKNAEFIHLMKITSAGHFQVSPARVEPMYQPEMSAQTGGTDVEVAP